MIISYCFWCAGMLFRVTGPFPITPPYEETTLERLVGPLSRPDPWESAEGWRDTILMAVFGDADFIDLGGP